MTSKTTHCYVAYCRECGGWVTVISDFPDMAQDIGRLVSKAVRSGQTVERMTMEAFKDPSSPPICSCARKRKLVARQTCLEF